MRPGSRNDRQGIEIAEDLSLEARRGLPDALRVLVERYPRDGWEAHPSFSALTRFWLDRHLMFRRLQAQLMGETQSFLPLSVGMVSYWRRWLRVVVSQPTGYDADLHIWLHCWSSLYVREEALS